MRCAPVEGKLTASLSKRSHGWCAPFWRSPETLRSRDAIAFFVTKALSAHLHRYPLISAPEMHETIMTAVH